MKSLADYTIVIRPDDNGTFVAYVPALDGCDAWGETLEAARAELNNVFDLISEEYQVYYFLLKKHLFEDYLINNIANH